MKVLVACEESQAVCKAFRALGHEAYSCDIQECSGGRPEWHIRGDCMALLNGVRYFITSDGMLHSNPKQWDLIIAHPPCTYLTSCSATWLFDKNHKIRDAEREKKGWAARDFFLLLLNADCKRIAIENPAPLHYWNLPKYDQIIEPYMFGHPWKKRTCLWLKNLPLLVPTNTVQPTGCWTYVGGGSSNRTRLKDVMGVRTPKERSKTFPGIAKAMAEQWSRYIEEKEKMKLYKCDFCGKLMSTDQPRSVTKIFGLDACPDCCRIADEIDLRSEYIRLVKEEARNEQLSL